MLCQGEGEDERPVAFESRKLCPAEINYVMHNKELLSVVHGLKHWRHFLLGSRFLVITDSTAAQAIMTKPDLNQRQARWIDLLANYDFEIRHRPGATNTVPDALSRRPDYSFNSLRIVVPGLVQRVRATAPADNHYQEMMRRAEQAPDKSPFFTVRHGLLYKDDRLSVPEDHTLRTDLLYETHDTPIAGHLGRTRTVERLKRFYYWPGMGHMTHCYVTSCPSCQSIKPEQRKRKGLLQPLPVSTQPWEHVSCDLTTGLPRTVTGHTAIPMVVDRHSKWMCCEQTTTDVTAEQLAHIFHRAVFRYHGVPRFLVSDRDLRLLAFIRRTAGH